MDTTQIPTPEELAATDWFNRMKPEHQAYLVSKSGTSVPVEALAFFKWMTGASPDHPRQSKGGRPPAAVAEKLHTVSVRLTSSQREKLRSIGPEKLRAWIDSYPV